MPKGIYQHKKLSLEARKKRMGINHPMFGKHHTEESKEKMRLAKIGTKNALGHKMSEESRIRMINSLKKVAQDKKDKGIMPIGWKGGYENRLYLNRLRLWRIKNNGGMHTLQQWLQMKKDYNNVCPCCLKKEPEIVLTVDHIIPISKGGTNDIENIQPLCRMCNLLKNYKIIEKYPISSK
jgi:5-methylcytosine-specific restriction endonuclease McrA